jgi:DNA repair protein RecN (Recombination protein N)
MLVELAVENLAVIERARVRFHEGLNVLTGETGSGKSLVVDALSLLFGGRAAAAMVRSGAERLRVTGIFAVQPAAAFAELLNASGIDLEDGELIVEREVLANGKSRAFVSGRAATAALLQELAPHLGDIHGQHDQQELFSPAAQRAMLDEFARNESLLARTAAAYGAWQRAAAELAGLERSEQERLRLVDLWQLQRREIEAVQPRAGEDAELENERGVLRNVARLQAAAAAAYEALYDAPESAATQIRTALKRIDELARIDAAAAAIGETLGAARIAVDEASHALREYAARLEADPARLDAVEARLAAIEKLKRKYGASIEEILAFLAEVRGRLEQAEDAGERRARLEKERAEAAREFEIAAGELSARRQDAARQLARKVEAELASLAMERTRFVVRMTPAEWSPAGADAVVFLVSPNPGEEPRPLDKVASGGELSRIALALKTCAAGRAQQVRTLVFDEVDAGVGGAAAESVGRRLKRLAAANQVLCVTHLPQIAGFADHHYAVEKRAVKGRTVAEVEELDAAARTREIGRMLSGQTLTPEALRHAQKLLQLGKGG